MYVLSMTWVKLLTEFYRITTRVVFYGSHRLHVRCSAMPEAVYSVVT